MVIFENFDLDFVPLKSKFFQSRKNIQIRYETEISKGHLNISDFAEPIGMFFGTPCNDKECLKINFDV